MARIGSNIARRTWNSAGHGPANVICQPVARELTTAASSMRDNGEKGLQDLKPRGDGRPPDRLLDAESLARRRAQECLEAAAAASHYFMRTLASERWS